MCSVSAPSPAKEGFIYDKAYQQKLYGVLFEAMMLGMQDPGSGKAIWRTGDVVDVLTNIQAMVLASSMATTSPTKLREFCTEHAKTLQRRISRCREQFATEGAPFETMVVHGDLN